jgi:hypothetical protein
MYSRVSILILSLLCLTGMVFSQGTEERLTQIQVSPRDIEIGGEGILWAITQQHFAYKVDLWSGAILDSFALDIPAENDGRGCAWDGTHLWYSEWDFDKIYKLDAATGSKVAEYSSPGSGPQALAYGGGYLWHTDEYSEGVKKIDPATGTVVATVPAPPGNGWYVGLAYNRGYLFLLSPSTDSLFAIRSSDGVVVGRMRYLHGVTSASGSAPGDMGCDDFNLYIKSDYLYKIPISSLINVNPITLLEETIQRVAEFRLFQNYPNPFNPSTLIQYAVPHRSHVTLSVFNVMGQRVTVLVDGLVDSGYHQVQFDGRGLASGVYFYRLQAGAFAMTRKLLVLR